MLVNNPSSRKGLRGVEGMGTYLLPARCQTNVELRERREGQLNGRERGRSRKGRKNGGCGIQWRQRGTQGEVEATAGAAIRFSGSTNWESIRAVSLKRNVNTSRK